MRINDERVWQCGSKEAMDADQTRDERSGESGERKAES